ncbi:hypothetical protein KR059_003484 [Drosophila kikkawai]|nr:hypothetical protein KR059_003484 [Drosophila kikkawai]
MSAIKAIFLLSFLAIFLGPRKTEAQAVVKSEWSKYGKCAQVVIEASSALARKIVPTIYEINLCTGFVAEPPAKGSKRDLLWFAKSIYAFFKKSVIDQPKCLRNLLDITAATIKPFSEQIVSLGCLDEDDYIF